MSQQMIYKKYDTEVDMLKKIVVVCNEDIIGRAEHVLSDSGTTVYGMTPEELAQDADILAEIAEVFREDLLRHWASMMDDAIRSVCYRHNPEVKYADVFLWLRDIGDDEFTEEQVIAMHHDTATLDKIMERYNKALEHMEWDVAMEFAINEVMAEQSSVAHHEQ